MGIARIVVIGVATLAAVGAGLGEAGAARPAEGSVCAVAREAPVVPARGRPGDLPVTFVPNAGQAAPGVSYHARGPGYALDFTRAEVVFLFTDGPAGSSPAAAAGEARGVRLGLRFVGANRDVAPEGRHETGGRVNYLVGSDPTRWRRGLPAYREVVYRELWPGIDLVFRGAPRQLKYDFILRPGADPKAIRLAYRGAGALSLDDAGNLRIQTSRGVLLDERPETYQEIGGRRVTVESHFVLEPGADGDGVFGFAVAEYDPRHPLIIDPGLAYSTFLGGNRADFGIKIALDAGGNMYVAGQTASDNFPSSPGAFDMGCGDPPPNSCAGTFSTDGFVVKLDPAGQLVYATFLGGRRSDRINHLAVDADGHVYATGVTFSGNFPTTVSAFDRVCGTDGACNFRSDAFIAKLDPTGAALLYSTFLGGRSFDEAFGLALDGERRVYVTGGTISPDFPTTAGAHDRICDAGATCVEDVFVAKLDPTAFGAASLVYSTLLGGTRGDKALAIAVDGLGQAHVTGLTGSADFPVTAGAFDPSYNGGTSVCCGFDAFLAKLDAAGANLLYASYLGGNGDESGHGIGLDAAGHVYVAGRAIPPFLTPLVFPTTAGAFDPSWNGGTDAFVAKFDTATAGSASLIYSTFLGGSGPDGVEAIAVDPIGTAYLTGFTLSPDFPTTPGAFDRTLNGVPGTGILDAFVAKLDPTGSGLLYGSYFGGPCGFSGFGGNVGSGIAIDAAGWAYVTGNTNAPGFPTTRTAFDRTVNGSFDAFVARLATTPRGGVEVLSGDVAHLVATGVLRASDGSAFQAHLGAAIQQLDAGNGGAAMNQLQAFVNEVNARILAGALPATDGQPLIDDARAIIDFIAYLGG